MGRALRAARRRRWPSWAVPTWASRRCSTASSARTAPWCTTCRHHPRTPSTPWFETLAGPIRFVDTAGMRRKAKIDDGTEYYSLVRAWQSIDTADIALLVVDATEGVTHQDQRLAERIDIAGCPIVVLPTSGSCSTPRAAPTWPTRLSDRLHFIGEAPVLKISALTGKGVHKLLPVLGDAIDRLQKRVPTREVNKALAAAQAAQPAPHGGRLLYATQGGDRPAHVHALRQQGAAAHLPALPRALAAGGLRFGATPIKLRVRKRS